MTMISHEDVTMLVDACRDGDIAEEELRQLQELLRTRNVTSEWVLDELEMSGMIAQALDTTNGDSFVRGLLERLSAERTAEGFVGQTHERLTSEQIGVEPAKPQSRPGLLSMIFGQHARNGEVGGWSGGGGRVTFLLLALVVVLALVVGGMLWGGKSTVGRVISSSPGVVVELRGEKITANSGLSLHRESRMVVPDNSQIVFKCRDETQIRAEGRTILGLAEAGVVSLQTGKLHVERHGDSAGDQAHIDTPHLQVRVGNAVFTCSATPSSTRLDVKMGEITYTTSGTGAPKTLGRGESVIVSP